MLKPKFNYFLFELLRVIVVFLLVAVGWVLK